MVMDATELGQAAGALMKDARAEWARLGMLQRHIDGKLPNTWMPAGVDSEYRDLLKKAGTPWLAFVRDAIAQGCRVAGYTNEDIWERVWRANGMDGRQGAVSREAVGLGKSYVLLLPGQGDAVVTRPMSVHNAYAVYTDPWDEYPAQVLYRIGKKRASFWDSDWYFVDQTAAYRFTGTPGAPQNITVTEHEQSFTPVVMIANELVNDREPESSVAGAISTYKRIVDATFTLQMLQRYGAFPQKWMAGGEIGTNADGSAAVRPSVDSLLHAKGDAGETARFGSFEASNLEQAVKALESHIRDLSATCQVPPHYLLGAVVNMSAEGIAAAESGYHRNLGDRKDSLGEGYELMMRTGALMLGETDAAESLSDHVEWENVSSWSLNQVADAVTKLDSVGADLAPVLQLIPGWSKADAAAAAAGARQRRAADLPRELAELIQKIYLGVGPVLTTEEARAIANRAGAELTGALPTNPPA